EPALAPGYTSLLRRELMRRPTFVALLGRGRRFVRIELMSRALLMSRTTALARDLLLLFFVHGGESPQTPARSTLLLTFHLFDSFFSSTAKTRRASKPVLSAVLRQEQRTCPLQISMRECSLKRKNGVISLTSRRTITDK